MRRIALASLLLALSSASIWAQGTSCYDLWYERNLIYAQNGYCFSSDLAKRVFAEYPCSTKNPQLTPLEQSRVAELRAEEKRRRCNVNNPVPENTQLEEAAHPEAAGILRAVATTCTPDWCKPVVKQVVGSYASVSFFCLKEVCENALAFLKKQSGVWILVDYGTGILPQDLIDAGFPASIAHALVE